MLKYSFVVFLLIHWVAPREAQAQQPQNPTGAWASETSGSNYYQGGSASDGTYLYIFGGFQDGQGSAANPYLPYQQLRRYDPVNDSWSLLGTMPFPTLYNAGAFSGGRLFSFGGYYYSYNGSSWSANYSNMIHAYDISSGSWTTLSATLSTARYYLTAATVTTAAGERIYAIGGTPGAGTNDEFNPSNNTVATRAPVSSGNGQAVTVYLHASAAVSSIGKVYVMGGLPTPNATVYEFTTPTSGSPNGTWTTRAPVQNGSGAQQTGYYRAAMTLNNRVYITGGLASPYNQTFEYNPATDTWAQRANMQAGRYGHAAVAVGNKGYVHGGYNAYTTCEEFTPPDFGSAPNAPSTIVQVGSRAESSLQAKTDLSTFDGWTNQQVSFTATVTDPNAGQQVRLRIQVKPESASWTSPSVVNLDSGLTAQGEIAVPWTIPAGGGYDWRYRVEDAFVNSHPAGLPTSAGGWVEAFGTETAPNLATPDFRSDQESPAMPSVQSPHNVDYQVPDPNHGDVLLQWVESTDNGPVAGIAYELQVAREGGFNDIEVQLFSPAGTSSLPVTLSVSRNDKFWRMRAQDVGGNFSEWSPALNFRVTYNDGENHSSGDANKYCGFGAGAPETVLPFLLLGLAIVSFGGRRLARR